MSRLRTAAWAVLPTVLAVAGGQSAPSQIRFTYENNRLQPQKFVVTVQADGSGSFHSEVGPAPANETANGAANEAENVGGNLAPVAQDRPIHISKALRDSLFAAARKNKLFAFPCDDKDKDIAYQGTKTLDYEGPEGKGSCSYNWSKNSQIDKLTDEFEAVASTLEEGAKLQRQYEHGRLSLDMEMEILEQMVHEGRATELENIAPILKTLAEDEAVLQRVQRRARALLAGAKND